MKVGILDYGAGNTRSVINALKRLGVETLLSNNTETLNTCDRIIFPGVGHAESAMQKIRELSLDSYIQNYSLPVLGICLGMQLMCCSSEEGNVEGLNIFPIMVKKFEAASAHDKIPHTGWSSVNHNSEKLFSVISPNEYFYFVHSYYVPNCEFTIGQTNHITAFSAALHRANFYGVQFHPEKSGKAGEQLLKNFLVL